MPKNILSNELHFNIIKCYQQCVAHQKSVGFPDIGVK